MPAFTFDQETHLYRLDGQKLPSVTEVLSDTGIVSYGDIHPRSREFYLFRGKCVHSATQFDDEGDLDMLTLSPLIRGFVEAWRKFKTDFGWQNDAIEECLYHPQHMYAGTIDRRGTMAARPRRKYVLDLKTGKAQSWVELQTAAYAGMLEDSRSYWRLCVELHDDGTYSTPFELPPASWFRHFTTFTCLLETYRARRRYNPSLAAAAA